MFIKPFSIRAPWLTQVILKSSSCPLWHCNLSRISASRPHHSLVTKEYSPNLCHEFARQLCRLVRSRAFTQQVIKISKWPYVRFSGVVFMRMDIDDATPDGVPSSLSEFQSRADIVFIEIPPGILQRARRQLAESDASQVQTFLESNWCALFEIFGETPETSNISQNILTDLHRDLNQQLISWSDRRMTLRTETDLSRTDGPELFHEDYLSHID